MKIILILQVQDNLLSQVMDFGKSKSIFEPTTFDELDWKRFSESEMNFTEVNIVLN